MRKWNLLLVMPRFVDKVGEWYHFPLGIPYISTCLKKKEFKVFTLNLNSQEGTIYDVLTKFIEDNNIDAILTGGLSFQYNAIREILVTARNIRKDIITIVGGGIITSSPEPAMKALELVDYGVIGEGETTVCELCHILENNMNIGTVKGIIYKKNNKYHTTDSREEIEELDTIEYPDYSGFDFEKITDSVASLLGINETNAITMLSSRSCPYRCTFCFHSSGNKYRQRSLDNFFIELDQLVKVYGVKYIFIADELFAYDMERVREFCRRIKQYDIKWWAQFRVSDITEDLVKILKDSNCVTMGFGIESADNRILKSMKKGIKIEQTEKALKLVYDSGITIQGGLIFGDIEETLETATNTLEWWKRHAHYGLSLNFITTYPGTGLYKHACEKGIITDEVQFIKQGCPTINISKMSKQELSWLVEQIVMLPQADLKEPNNLTDININYLNPNISFKGDCVHCNAENNWSDIRFFTRNVLTCTQCGGKHKVPIIEDIKNSINENVEVLLKEYGKVAFWGINDYFADVSRQFKVLSDSNVYFVDNSEIKQGSMVNNKTINSPEILKKLDINLVIIPVVSLFTTIEKQVKSDFQNVDRIVSILDLITRTN